MDKNEIKESEPVRLESSFAKLILEEEIDKPSIEIELEN